MSRASRVAVLLPAAAVLLLPAIASPAQAAKKQAVAVSWPKAATAATTVRISGRVSAGSTARRAALEQRSGSRWVRRPLVAVGRQRRFTVVWRVPAAGPAKLRIVVLRGRRVVAASRARTIRASGAAPAAEAAAPAPAPAPTPQPPAPPPATISAYGIGALTVEGIADTTEGLADLTAMGGAGLGLYRTRFRQDLIEVGGMPSDWAQTDRLARQAALRGIELLPVLIDLPGEVYDPPVTDAERERFARFALAAVGRYGPSGTFWAGCGCPKLPVRAWEIWNEPNIAPFWDGPDPAAYAALLTSARQALRSADPGARIVFGGLAHPQTTNAQKLDAAAFLRDVIAVTGPDAFDALSLHAYFRSDAPPPDFGVDSILGPTVAVLQRDAGVDAAGAPRQQVWVTELGRTSQQDDPITPADERAETEAGQLQYYDGFLGALEAKRASWNLGPIVPYALRDAPVPTASWQRYGLRRTTAGGLDSGAKPAWDLLTTRSRAAAPILLPVPR